MRENVKWPIGTTCDTHDSIFVYIQYIYKYIYSTCTCIYNQHRFNILVIVSWLYTVEKVKRGLESQVGGILHEEELHISTDTGIHVKRYSNNIK